MGKVNIRKTEFGGWKNCLELSNGIVRCIVTTDVGPRILFYGFEDGENEFYINSADAGQTGGDSYRFYGGHRLWHGPQEEPRCCLPDNEPVEYSIEGSGVILTQKTEAESHIQKIIKLVLAEDSSKIQVEHTMINHGMWNADLTIWALTQMTPGGVEYIPRCTKKNGLLPNQNIVLWSWTDLSDYRITWGKDYITLRQDPDAPEIGEDYIHAVKIGVDNREGYAGYFRNGHLFVKTFQTVDEAVYPDGGCTCETYTDPAMIELESLSPMISLKPGESASHTEEWQLFDGIGMPESQEEAKDIFRKVFA